MSEKKVSASLSLKHDVVVLQADVAYFDARLTLIRPKAKTTHEVAQKKVFKFLEEVFSKHLDILLERRKQRLIAAKKQRLAQ